MVISAIYTHIDISLKLVSCHLEHIFLDLQWSSDIFFFLPLPLSCLPKLIYSTFRHKRELPETLPSLLLISLRWFPWRCILDKLQMQLQRTKCVTRITLRRSNGVHVSHKHFHNVFCDFKDEAD